MSNCVALLAEPDRALRHLMYEALAGAGYEVFESSNVAQVEVTLRVRAVYRAKNLLCVLGSRLAADCAPGISAAALERAQWGLPEAQLILTSEFGTLPMASDIAHCQVRGVLEKPFDLYELQALAFECRDFLCESGPMTPPVDWLGTGPKGGTDEDVLTVGVRPPLSPASPCSSLHADPETA